MPSLLKKSAASEAHSEALKVLRSCVRPVGFFASGLPGGYEALWARDSMITSLGATTVNNEFKTAIGRSIATLSRHQSRNGQIPNAVGTYNLDRRSNITFNSIDSSLWYIIGNYVYARAYRDQTLIKKYRQNIENAFTWLRYQDPNEDGLPVQQPTMDWQDAFPHKYGRVINTQALYYAALRFNGKNKTAERLKKIVNGEIEKYLSLYDPRRGYYLPWVWKNHDGDREAEYWFDALGNLLAIVTGLATPRIAKSILRYIEKNKINQPYPCKAIYPPIIPGGKEWHSYFSQSESRKPYEYLNGGVWPFIGGFYVAALVKAGEIKKAETELHRLALAVKEGMNRVWGFHEWLHGISGNPVGGSSPYQAWTAGTYVFAYECLKRKRILFF